MIAVVDYRAGNIGSVVLALQRIGIGNFEITNDREKIRSADGVVFPGQGRAGPAMQSLRETGLDVVLPDLKQPFLGICLGMQLLMKSSEEDSTKTLGIIDGKVRRIQSSDLPIPHMGWNSIKKLAPSKLLNEVEDNSFCYFANSFAIDDNCDNATATSKYNQTFTAALEKDNFYGVQFHPEKSAKVGEKILLNFVDMCGIKK